MRDLKYLQKSLSYEFKRLTLLRRALTHPSYANEKNIKDNQRLEFLGDSVLGLFVTEALYRKYPDLNEGQLSKFRSRLVSREMLVDVAHEIRLGEYLRLGGGEELAGGRRRASSLADAMESVIGAVFLDGGLEPSRRLVRKLFRKLVEGIESSQKHMNYKGQLQEMAQRKLRVVPQYRIVSQKGPEHDKQFTVLVKIGKDLQAKASGYSKKEAQQKAAQEALELLKGIKESS